MFKPGDVCRIVAPPWGSPVWEKMCGERVTIRGIFRGNSGGPDETLYLIKGEPHENSDVAYALSGQSNFSVQESALKKIGGFGEWAKTKGK